MIVLDTNVVSELINAAPHPSVRQWFLQTPPKSTFISTVTIAELRYGLAILPAGRRKDILTNLIDSFLATALRTHALHFDEPAANAYATIRANGRKIGHTVPQLDAQIAAIAKAQNATLATRNTADFAHTGITLINPWTHSP